MSMSDELSEQWDFPTTSARNARSRNVIVVAGSIPTNVAHADLADLSDLSDLLDLYFVSVSS